MLFGQLFFPGVLTHEWSRLLCTAVLFGFNVVFLAWLLWRSFLVLRDVKRHGEVETDYKQRPAEESARGPQNSGVAWSQAAMATAVGDVLVPTVALQGD
jgi:hypothetical protein